MANRASVMVPLLIARYHSDSPKLWKKTVAQCVKLERGAARTRKQRRAMKEEEEEEEVVVGVAGIRKQKQEEEQERGTEERKQNKRRKEGRGKQKFGGD